MLSSRLLPDSLSARPFAMHEPTHLSISMAAILRRLGSRHSCSLRSRFRLVATGDFGGIDTRTSAFAFSRQFRGRQACDI